jgi:hypothetical protein
MQAREKVLEAAEWFVYSFDDLMQYLRRHTIAIIGSGAWACAAARMVAQNTAEFDPADEFVDEVKMWVHEEEYEARCSLSFFRTIWQVSLRTHTSKLAACAAVELLIHRTATPPGVPCTARACFCSTLSSLCKQCRENGVCVSVAMEGGLQDAFRCNGNEQEHSCVL